jgi:hypothetical protein
MLSTTDPPSTPQIIALSRISGARDFCYTGKGARWVGEGKAIIQTRGCYLLKTSPASEEILVFSRPNHTRSLTDTLDW